MLGPRTGHAGMRGGVARTALERCLEVVVGEGGRRRDMVVGRG